MVWPKAGADGVVVVPNPEGRPKAEAWLANPEKPPLAAGAVGEVTAVWGAAAGAPKPV